MRLLVTSLFTLTLCSGCSAYTASQMALLAQARKGVAIWSARETARDDDVKQSHAARRKALDDAFDADARLQTSPSADWIIEARKAYATGLSAINQSESAALAANSAARQNAAATDAALNQLQIMISIPLGIESLFNQGAKP